MKKFSILTIFLLSIFLIACSSNTTLTFSEYYQNADDFEEIEPLLNDYFSCIQTAYDKSDKLNLESFVLSDNYKDITSKLSEISNDTSNLSISDEYMTKLKLIEPYLRMEVYLAEREMLLSANNNSLQKEEWFNEVKEFLNNTYSEYENGNGE